MLLCRRLERVIFEHFQLQMKDSLQNKAMNKRTAILYTRIRRRYAHISLRFRPPTDQRERRCCIRRRLEAYLNLIGATTRGGLPFDHRAALFEMNVYDFQLSR